MFRDLDHDFRILYSTTGRPSIPPEQLLSALRLQVFCGVRSERQLMEQLDYILLHRWFVGLASDDAVWDATTFMKNRERLQQGDMFNRFKETLLHHQAVTPLLSDEHFSVDGRLVEVWAGHKSFKPKSDTDGNGGNFHGTTCKNNRHESTTDPARCLYRTHPHPETAGAEGIEVSENVKPFRYGTENPLPLKIPTRRYLKTQKLPSEKRVFQ